MIWVTADDVIALHSRIIERSGGMDGLRDRALLEAAVAAPLQSFGNTDLYPTVPEKAARLGYGLASNHAFLDGNKRIGAHVMLVFLALNGIELSYTQQELIDIIFAVAADRANNTDLLQWIIQHQN